MEGRKTIFDYLGQILMSFGFTMLCMMLIVMLFGEQESNYSAFFALGSEGLPISVMFQYLGLSVIVVMLRMVFFTQGLIRKMGVGARSICMVVSMLIVIIGFIWLFGWFPVNRWEPWVMFLLCFACCFAGSTAVVALKNKMENKRLAEGLSKMQAELEAQNGDSAK